MRGDGFDLSLHIGEVIPCDGVPRETVTVERALPEGDHVDAMRAHWRGIGRDEGGRELGSQRPVVEEVGGRLVIGGWGGQERGERGRRDVDVRDDGDVFGRDPGAEGLDEERVQIVEGREGVGRVRRRGAPRPADRLQTFAHQRSRHGELDADEGVAAQDERGAPRVVHEVRDERPVLRREPPPQGVDVEIRRGQVLRPCRRELLDLPLVGRGLEATSGALRWRRGLEIGQPSFRQRPGEAVDLAPSLRTEGLPNGLMLEQIAEVPRSRPVERSEGAFHVPRRQLCTDETAVGALHGGERRRTPVVEAEPVALDLSSLDGVSVVARRVRPSASSLLQVAQSLQRVRFASRGVDAQGLLAASVVRLVCGGEVPGDLGHPSLGDVRLEERFGNEQAGAAGQRRGLADPLPRGVEFPTGRRRDGAEAQDQRAVACRLSLGREHVERSVRALRQKGDEGVPLGLCRGRFELQVREDGEARQCLPLHVGELRVDVEAVVDQVDGGFEVALGLGHLSEDPGHPARLDECPGPDDHGCVVGHARGGVVRSRRCEQLPQPFLRVAHLHQQEHPRPCRGALSRPLEVRPRHRDELLVATVHDVEVGLVLPRPADADRGVSRVASDERSEAIDQLSPLGRTLRAPLAHLLEERRAFPFAGRFVGRGTQPRGPQGDEESEHETRARGWEHEGGWEGTRRLVNIAIRDRYESAAPCRPCVFAISRSRRSAPTRTPRSMRLPV